MKSIFAAFRFRKNSKQNGSGTRKREEDWTAVRITDTIRWFNASYAVLTKINHQDYNRFGGLPANRVSMNRIKQMLSEWWSVTDRASADSTLEWILEEGHRARFAENNTDLRKIGIGQVMKRERLDFLLGHFQLEEKDARKYVRAYDLYERYGMEAIDGWDYCRALNLMSFYYLAGYYSEKEALDKSLEIARKVQLTFTSWEDLVDSYLRGYEYWAEESSDERRGIFEELKAAPDNPYRVDFKMKLEKTW